MELSYSVNKIEGINVFLNLCNEGINNKNVLRGKFSKLEGETSFSANELQYFAEQAKACITKSKTAKFFTSSTSESLVKFLHENQPSDLLKPHLALHYCQNMQLNAEATFAVTESIFDTIPEEKISRWMYKFSSHLIKRDPNGFSKEIACFDLKDNAMGRQIAELALNYGPSSFFENLSEYRFMNDDSIRESFFIKGLMRSVDVAEQLIDDGWFIDHLKNNKEDYELVLEALYEKFHFGQSLIQQSKINEQHGFSEAKFFSELLTNHRFGCSIRSQFNDAAGFLSSLDDTEQHSFLAMMLFLNTLENREEMIKNPGVLSFLVEIHSMKHPNARFAAIFLAQKYSFLLDNEKAAPFLGQKYPLFVDKTLDYPKIFAIIARSCSTICADQTIPIQAKKWKDADFRSNFICFIAELHLAETLAIEDKGEILRNIFGHKDWSSSESLIAASSCLRQHFIKPLLDGIPPENILRDRLLQTLNQLGGPYKCSLTLQEAEKLKHHQEIGHYARGLLRLPESDQARIIPFFFHFLKLSIDGKMEEERYNSPDLQSLFSKYQINQDIWKNGSKTTVEEILKKFPTLASSTDGFSIQSAIKTALENNHLAVDDYSPLDAFINSKESDESTVFLKGELIGKYSKSKNAEEKTKYKIDRLANLYKCTTATRQLSFVNQLLKVYEKDDDFKIIDLDQWKKALDAITQKKQVDYGNHRIIRSGDPYMLFRIGSLAGQSCQRVTGDPGKNKCLMAYPSDGKNQVIYSESPSGEITARAILRFFETGTRDAQLNFTSSGLVLYLEPFYPSGAPNELREAMTLSAIDCARELGVPLVRFYKGEEKQEKDSPLILQTINGPAPYEYFDGIKEGKIKENNYTFSEGGTSVSIGWIKGANVKVLYDPQKPV